jgi:hypothetical protein
MKNFLKSLDVVSWILLVVGGLNWGLVGFFEFNLVAAIFGEMTILSRIIYAAVGLSALYELATLKRIQERWAPICRREHMVEPRGA